MIAFIHSFQSEWLKKKGSLAVWIVIGGSLFTPLIIIIARLVQYKKLPLLYANNDFWLLLWKSAWESMAIFLLPLGVMLLTSLITQLEYKNNTWKQLHALPLSFTTIFFSKLVVIICMVFQLFLLFNISIYFSAIIPYWLISAVPYPTNSIPFFVFFKENIFFFIDCLPIIALQYLLSLQFKNFLVSVGIGFLLWIGALAALSWNYSYLLPYSYCILNYLKNSSSSNSFKPNVNIHYVAIAYFVLFTIISYTLYIKKKEKG